MAANALREMGSRGPYFTGWGRTGALSDPNRNQTLLR
jgi:hypothetical protein